MNYFNCLKKWEIVRRLIQEFSLENTNTKYSKAAKTLKTRARNQCKCQSHSRRQVCLFYKHALNIKSNRGTFWQLPRVKSLHSHKNLHSVYNGFVHNCQNLEATKVFLNGGINRLCYIQKRNSMQLFFFFLRAIKP